MGFIYKLICHTNDLIYIGSTRSTLKDRLRLHVIDTTCSSKIIIAENNYEIILIEEVEDDDMLLIREQYHMDNDVCINKNRAVWTLENHRKNRLKSYHKHKEKNRETVKDRQNKKFTCECGGKYTYVNKLRHCKSKKHINHVNLNLLL